VVLSAGHCMQAGASYRVQYRANGLRQFSDVLDWAVPPQFDPQVKPVVADLALIRFSNLSPEIGLATLGLNEPPAWPGDQVTVVGGGIAFKGLHETGFNRMATLTVAPGPLSDLQIRLVDSSGKPATIGACLGDSGSPVFEIRPDGPKVIAVVSWAIGPNETKGCGGVTGATPLSPYRQWIIDTMRTMN
jgi:Trypsin